MFPVSDEDRMPVFKLTNGDTWRLDFLLYLPSDRNEPASRQNSVVRFVLSENRFAPAIWEGRWDSGIEQDSNRKGLVHVKIPGWVSYRLRRGIYSFSVTVSDLLGDRSETEAEGSIQVEYEPTSDMKSIPYRDGTMEEKP